MSTDVSRRLEQEGALTGGRSVGRPGSAGDGDAAAGSAVAVLSADRIAELVGSPSPTAEQRRIIEAPLAPSLVVAGAGSGKTETMAGRVVWLIANGLVTPEQVLGLTFTRKAAGELAERVRRRLRQLVRAAARSGVELPGRAGLAEGAHDELLGALVRPTVATYNAYAASLVGDHALRLGLDPSSRLLGEAAQWQLAAEVVEAWSADLELEVAMSTVVEAVLSLSGALDEHLLEAAEARARIESLVEAAEAVPAGQPPREHYAKVRDVLRSLDDRARLLDVVDEYRRRRREADAMDFGDQIALAARLARDVPEVGAAERERFRVVLLDEYQDTSYAQLTLLSALFGDGHPVTAVGDPHQSIYGWRGASAGGIDQFPATFCEVLPDGDRRPARVHLLSTSWRNDERILEVANHAAAPLRARTRVDVPVLAARPGAGPGHVEAYVAETLADEARAVARFVKEHWRPAGPGVERRTAAVLCRKRAQFAPLHRALRDAGLPVEVVGLGGLLSTPEVVDLVATLQAVHDPSRGDALMRLLTGARTRLGAADLHALAAWSGELASRHGLGRRGAATSDGTVAARTDGMVGTAADGTVAADASVAVSTGTDARAEEPALVEADVVDERSIVDALDDLPPAGWTSRTGRSLTPAARERLTELAGILRTLRSHAYLAIPDLVVEAERLLGLDIEVAVRGAGSPGRARAHLDAFQNVAVEFVRSADHPTLGAFLAWLEAADAQENGLELPVVEPDPDAVQIITVHAAKGLEWDVVAVAGLVDGGLPATVAGGKDGPRDSAWLTSLGALPYPLRGDRHELPVFDMATAADRKELEERRKRFVSDAGEHAVAEERRLAYVAFTRARSDLLLTAAWWGTGVQAKRVSPFLTELVDAGLVTADGWAPEPPAGAANPQAEEAVSVTWPADPFAGGPRRAAAERAAGWVRAALAGVAGDGTQHPTAALWSGPPSSGSTSSGPASSERAAAGPAALEVAGAADGRLGERPSRWEVLADRLLEERARVRAPAREVELPAHLSASALVRLARDADEFALDLRRPVPARPSPQARRGTRFHTWVEAFFGSAALVDVDALPGADEDEESLDEQALREGFLATEWAQRRPLAVEVDVETSVDGYVLRSRIDAVFADEISFGRSGVGEGEGAEAIPAGASGPAGAQGVVVVDWKTGAPPHDPRARAARELQLAVYRLAWSRWTGTPLERVRAAFCYVGHGVTVYPERLLDEAEIVSLLRGATGD